MYANNVTTSLSVGIGITNPLYIKDNAVNSIEGDNIKLHINGRVNTSGSYYINGQNIDSRYLKVSDASTTYLTNTSFNDYNLWIKNNSTGIAIIKLNDDNNGRLIELGTSSGDFQKLLLDVYGRINAKYFIGEKFHEGLKVVPVLLFANLFLGVYLNLSMWYKLSGQTKYGAWFSIVGAAITIILNFILIPVMGYMGAAWATFICYGAMMFISYIYGQKHYPIPYNIKICLLIILLSVGLWITSDYLFVIYPMGILLSNITKLIVLSVFIMVSWRLIIPSSTTELVDEQ
jgi:hypothetical protein